MSYQSSEINGFAPLFSYVLALGLSGKALKFQIDSVIQHHTGRIQEGVDWLYHNTEFTWFKFMDNTF